MKSLRIIMLFVLFTCSPLVASTTHEPHPQAPQQLHTFAFLIGEHLCDDVLTAQDGTIKKLKGHWSGRYILNGNAIQDDYWNTDYSATNVRVFDPAQGKWLVTYFRYPNYRSGTWEGNKQGGKIVLKRAFSFGGQDVISELVFDNISRDGFDWQSSYISDTSSFVNWTSDCQRVSQ